MQTYPRTSGRLALFALIVMTVISACGSASAPGSAGPASSAAPATSAAPPSSAAAATSAAPPSSAAAATSAAAPTSAAGPATSAAGPAPAGQPLTKVTACIPAKADAILPIFAAQDAGYLKQQGIEATLPYFAGGKVDVALAAGQCTFVFGAGGVGPLLQGVGIKLVAVTANTSAAQLWGNPPLKTIAEMKGHSIGTSGPGSLSYRMAVYFLNANHLSVKDVSVLNTGDTTTTIAAVLAKRVDAALLFPPATYQAQQGGLNLIYSDPKLQMMSTGLATTSAYLKAHRAVVKGAVKAVAMATQRLKTDEAFYASELRKFTSSKASDAVIRRAWQATSKVYNSPPRGTLHGAVTALGLYDAEAKGQNLNAVAKRWLDMSLVNELFPPKG